MSDTLTISKAELESMVRSAASEAAAAAIKASAEAQPRDAGMPALLGRAESPHVADEKPVDQMTSKEKATTAARCMRLLACNANDARRAIDQAKRLGNKRLAGEWEKALGTETLAGGGALIPPGFATGIIELLRNASAVRKLGARQLPMNGSLTMPFLSTGATASYVGQNANITKTEPTFGQLVLSDKKLAALVPTSNDLLEQGGQMVDTMLAEDIVAAMAVAEDLAFIRSDGSAGEPKGLLYWAASAANTLGRFDANGTVNAANVVADLGLAEQELRDKNVGTETCGWIFSNRTYRYLSTLLDSNGHYLFREEMLARKTLNGYPYVATAQIPDTLGSGNKSEVYLVAFGHTVIGESSAMKVESFPGAAYYDGSTIISGVSQDQTVFRAISKHDFGCRHRGKEVAVIEAVAWGA